MINDRDLQIYPFAKIINLHHRVKQLSQENAHYRSEINNLHEKVNVYESKLNNLETTFIQQLELLNHLLRLVNPEVTVAINDAQIQEVSINPASNPS
jgi:predicted nuclease with TOPRIM domain